MLKIKVIKDGPLYFFGTFVYLNEEMLSRVMKHDSLAFCRCGRTGRAPFCDESHNSFSFNTQDQLECEYVVTNERPSPEDGSTAVAGIKGGPLHISGPVSLVDKRSVIWQGNQVKLCRCGASQMKPFCDGAHKKID